MNPQCPVTGHSGWVYRVAFTDDGEQVISASDISDSEEADGAVRLKQADGTVRLFDVASGRQVRQFAGGRFALVEGLSGEHKRDRHVITAHGSRLRIYEIGDEEQHAEDGAAAAPVASFKARQCIDSVRCFGATICVGCTGGAVCILSAPFLAA